MYTYTCTKGGFSMALKDYPDWVLKFKDHNREIRFINGKFYLYSVHTVRNKDKVKKITDEYLGRITEDGLIPKSKKVIPYYSKEYYSTVFVFNVFANSISAIKKKHPSNWKAYLKASVFNLIFHNDIVLWNKSYLSVILFDDNFKSVSSIVSNEISRISSMFKYHLDKFLNNSNLFEFFYSISDLQMIKSKNDWFLCIPSDNTKAILSKYNFSLEVSYVKA